MHIAPTTPPNGLSAKTKRRRLLPILLIVVCVSVVLTVLPVVVIFVRLAMTRPITDPDDYVEARAYLASLHGSLTDHFPDAIPTTATNVQLHASYENFLQAEPFMKLSFQLPADQIAIELARLRSLGPTNESQSRGPSTQYDVTGVEFKYGEALWPHATVWVNPESGMFVYWIRDD